MSPIHHPAHFALAVLALVAIVLAVMLARVHHDRARKIYHSHFSENIPRERMLYASIGFYIGFAGIRAITHAIRAGRGPFHDVSSSGGLHIHHMVWGILLLLIVGYCWLWQISLRARWIGRTLAFLYGIGAALTLDEFALWLNLRDVYWERQGRESIDALLLFGAFLSISLFGGPFFRALSREALHPTRKPTLVH